MIDAPSGSAAPAKKSGGKAKGGEGGTEGKKRFEVKKVCRAATPSCHGRLTDL